MYFQGHKDVKAVERKVHIVPSGRISSIEVCHMLENGKPVVLKEGQTIEAIAGQNIQGLSMFYIGYFYVKVSFLKPYFE